MSDKVFFLLPFLQSPDRSYQEILAPQHIFQSVVVAKVENRSNSEGLSDPFQDFRCFHDRALEWTTDGTFEVAVASEEGMTFIRSEEVHHVVTRVAWRQNGGHLDLIIEEHQNLVVMQWLIALRHSLILASIDR